MRKFMVRALPVAGALAGAMVLAPGLYAGPAASHAGQGSRLH
jgi:hypothetical protein